MCRTVKPLTEFHRDNARRDGCQGTCKACITLREKARYAANREAVAEYNRRTYAEKRDERREGVRQYGVDLKAKVLAHYGTACSCCGTTEDLTVDHINGDGREYRKIVFGDNKTGGAPVYRWIIANGFPDDLQTLCRPCNRSKGTGEHCRLDHATC